MLLTRSILLFVSLSALAACGPEGSVCVDLPTDCSPQYEPTFDNIHDRTLTPGCAVSGGACHANAGAQGGLTLEDAATAYENLTRGGRLESGDPACSLIVERLYSDDAAEQMPPGKPLSDGERCAIVQWIEDGASR